MGRTYQKSRLFLGLSVEDNLYLAVLGSRGGHLRLTRKRALDGEMRERARELARTVGLDTQIDEPRGLDLARRAAPARGRDGAGRRNPSSCFSTSRPQASRAASASPLTDLLLELDKSVTLILIEHDMDVALRVARERHDDARRAQDRGGHARRDPRQRASSTSSTSAGA